jgi:hypothetical protein
MGEPYDCQECGMLIEELRDYHPYSFCVWKKAGLDPWKTLQSIAHDLWPDAELFTSKPEEPPHA